MKAWNADSLSHESLDMKAWNADSLFSTDSGGPEPSPEIFPLTPSLFSLFPPPPKPLTSFSLVRILLLRSPFQSAAHKRRIDESWQKHQFLILTAPGLSRRIEITKLLLNVNDLRDLPEGMATLTELRILSVANNKLMRIPTVLCDLFNLSSLIFDDNMIKELPEAINKLALLANLSAAHNAINRLPGKLSGLKQLRKLCLDGNPLGEIPNALLDVTALQSLSMRDCGLAVVPDTVTRLRQLRELHVAENALEGLPDLQRLAHLRLLRLSNNKLQQLPSTCVHLVDLEELSIGGNSIQRLPVDFSRLTNLQILQIDGDNFDSVPQEVLLSFVLPQTLHMEIPPSISQGGFHRQGRVHDVPTNL